jgi:probable HAF family extracellular repeat protein
MRRCVLGIALLVAVVGGFVGPAPVTASATGSVGRGYHITPLADPVSGTVSRSDAYGVNARGQVAGSITNADGIERAAIWGRHGAPTLLGTFGGFTSVAHDINGRGVVVGAADAADGASYAFSWNPVTRRMANLGTLGGRFSAAWGVNDAGVVVGYADTAAGLRHAFRFDPRRGKMEDLGTLGGDGSVAWGINNRGQIAGEATNTQYLTHAVRWDRWTRKASDLGVLPGKIVSFAQDINDRGEVVGWSADVADESDQAFLWSPRTGVMTTLKGLGAGFSEARAIGPDGTVVGLVSAGEQRRAFVWRRTTGVTILPALHPEGSAEALDINRRGIVVGGAETATGQGSAVRWTKHRH